MNKWPGGTIQRVLLAGMILGLSLLPLRFQSVLAERLEQANDPRARAEETLQQLTPEERVAQLFLVTFRGSVLDPNTPEYNLIVNRHIGGVVLLAENDNFTEENTISEAYRLISQIQQAAWEDTLEETGGDLAGDQPNKRYVPFLIGTIQEGDGYPYDQIFSGLSGLPSPMAIGATWRPDLSKQVGLVLGDELASIGINLLLGPSLDVLENPGIEARENLGIRVFGGDPYWVQEMGKAFIAGVHQGSQGKIAVIVNHFPGQGGTDRIPDDEVATVRKSLEQLKQIELAPFNAVTGLAPNAESTTDGVMVSHIRYQGFQGNNIRQTTSPISLDPLALSQILALPEYTSWHSNGGLVVSDDLGSRAVRRFYDPLGKTFDAIRVARDAFLAGNDLLYVNNFTASGDPDSYTTLLRTLDSFSQKYRVDPAFAQRVDESVLRILTLKYRLYPQTDLNGVVPPVEDLATLGYSGANQLVSFEVARSAVSLLSPSISELPRPPERNDRMLFITDTKIGRQCSVCSSQVQLEVDALQSAILNLYGTDGSGQVLESRMSSYSFQDLYSLINRAQLPTPEITPLENDLTRSTWIIFSMVSPDANQPASMALRQFLAERPEYFTNKNLVVFAFNAPYFLDATDVSKLTAYYALYSKTPSFVEVAARVLFQEIAPLSNSPVSIPGIGYDLLEITSPDPGQLITLRLDVTTPLLEVTVTPGEPTPIAGPTFKVGDLLPLEAGPIRDHNGNLVPDGTVVRFNFSIDGGAGGSQLIEAFTGAEGDMQGFASVVFHIEQQGLLEIRASSDQAQTSDILRLDITGSEPAAITAIAPTIFPTETPTPTPTQAVTPTPTATPVPIIDQPDFTDWILAMLVTGVGAVLVYLAGFWWASVRWGLRWGLCVVLGGLAAYTYIAIGLPGGSRIFENSGSSGLISATIVGALTGFVAGLVWRNWGEQKNLRHEERNP